MNTTMNTTLIPALYENSTYLDNVEKSNENVTIVGDVDILDPEASFCSVPKWLVSVMMSISTWTIVANGLVFLCLVTSGKALKNNVHVQLLSLSFTDMLVGVITIPFTWVLITMRNVKYEACASFIYMYFVAQSATLFHTLLIGVNRLLTIKSTTNVNGSNTAIFKRTLKQILAIWVCCFLANGIHFIAFGRFGTTVTRCSTAHIFEDKEQIALGIMFILTIIPPHVCVNIIYGYLLMYIRKKLRSVAVVNVVPNNKTGRVKLASDRAHDKRLSIFKTKIRALADTQANQLASVDMAGHSCNSSLTKARVQPINGPNAGPSTANESKSDSGDSTDKNFQTHAVNSRNTSKVEQNQTSHSRLGLEKQKRVMVTFGLLLVSLNVFMTPFDFFAVFEIFNNGRVSRGFRLTFVAMAMLNSALNPLINIWRIKPFRVVMREKVTKIYDSFRRT